MPNKIDDAINNYLSGRPIKDANVTDEELVEDIISCRAEIHRLRELYGHKNPPLPQ